MECSWSIDQTSVDEFAIQNESCWINGSPEIRTQDQPVKSRMLYR